MELILIIFIFLVIIGIISIVILIKVFSPGTDEKTTGSLIPKIDVPLPRKLKQSFKRCPRCQSTFTDQSLNFCLSDGTPLEGAGGASDEMETIVRRWR